MRYLSIVRGSEKYNPNQQSVGAVHPPAALMEAMDGGWSILETDSKAEALRLTTEFLDLHRKHWPECESEFECEVRPIVYQAKP